jgi:hypothetical protein
MVKVTRRRFPDVERRFPAIGGPVSLSGHGEAAPGPGYARRLVKSGGLP